MSIMEGNSTGPLSIGKLIYSQDTQMLAGVTNENVEVVFLPGF